MSFRLNSSNLKSTMLISRLLGVGIIPLAAQANSSPQQALTTPTQASPDSTDGPAEIVVTAQKRAEHLVDVPISVTVASQEQLTAAGVTDMASLAQIVPGLHLDSSGAFFQPSLRGVGTAISGAGASANVATYVDGIYKPNALSNAFAFIDVDSIQVLKGPQGTLFGRNTTGGAILVTTEEPSADTRLRMKVGYGSFGSGEASLFATTSLTDTLAGSIALGYTRSDGWITNTLTGRDVNPSKNYIARAKLLFTPAEDWKFILTLSAEGQDDPTLNADASWRGYSDAAAFFGVPVAPGHDPRQVTLGAAPLHKLDSRGVNLRAEGNLGFAKLTSYTSAYWDKDHELTVVSASAFPANGTLPVQPCPTLLTCSYLGTGGYAFLETASPRDTEKTYSQEFDLSHSGELLDWVTGLYYFYDKTTYAPFTTALFGPFGPGGVTAAGSCGGAACPPWPTGSFIDTGDQDAFHIGATAQSVAGFADATYHLGSLADSLEKYHLTVGGRYDLDRAGVFYTSYAVAATSFTYTPYSSASTDFHSFTPRAVLRYSMTSDSNFYVSWSQGSKAGLYNPSGYLVQKTPVAPEKLTDVEGGYKVARPDWQLEASLFHYDYRDLQVASYEGAVAFLQNAPAARIYGGELHWRQNLLSNFRLDVGLAYTHARYVDFKDAAIQTFSAVLGVVNGSTDVSGGVMERTPTYTGTAALHYDHPLFDGTVSLDANYSFQTKASFDFANTLTQGGYGLANLHVDWTDPSKRWTFSVTGRNITNKVYLVQVLPNAGGFGEVFGEPASVTVDVDYRL